MVATESAWVGRQIGAGRYRVTSLLGEGGMGLVYRAEDANLETEVVIKVPRAAAVHDAEFVSRFGREVRSLVQLSHPHVVHVIDVGQNEGVPYVVLQYLPGGNLEDCRPRDAQGRVLPMDPATLSAWLPQMAAALDFIHSRGYIHRDVKPSNILFDRHGNPFLGDFGVAKALAASQESADTALTGTGMVLGTPHYVSPEWILGQPVDGRVDQYALAVMVYELIAGRPPIDGVSPTAILVAHTMQPPPPLWQHVPGAPQALSDALDRGLAKQPAERFASCTEFARAALSASAPATSPPTAPPQTLRKGRVSTVSDGTGRCPACGLSIRLGDHVRGKKAKCNGCGSRLLVATDLMSIAELVAPPVDQSLVASSVPQSLIATPASGHIAQTQAFAQPVMPNPVAHRAVAVPPAAPIAAPLALAPATARRPVMTSTTAAPTVPESSTRAEFRRPPARQSGTSLAVVRMLGIVFGGILGLSLGYWVLIFIGGSRLDFLQLLPNASEQAAATKPADEPTVPEWLPQLDRISDPTIAVDGKLAIAVQWKSDPPSDQTWQFRLADGAPEGMSIDPTSGVLEWPADVEHPQGTYPVTVVAQCSDTPKLHTQRSFVVTVTSKNEPSVVGKSPNASARGPQAIVDNRAATSGTAMNNTSTLGNLANQGATTSRPSTPRVLVHQDQFNPSRTFHIPDRAAATFVSISRDRTQVLAGTVNHKFHLWRVSTGQHSDYGWNLPDVCSMALSPDGDRALAGMRVGNMVLVDISGKVWTKDKVFPGHTRDVLCIAYNMDGSQALSGSKDTTAILWNAKSGARLKVFKSAREIDAVAFHHDGSQIATGGADKLATLWDASSGNKLRTFEGHTGSVCTLAFSPDGKYLLTGADGRGDKSSILWNVSNAALVHRFEGCIPTFSADGKWVLTGLHDGSAIIWDVASGQKVRTYRHGDSPLMSVNFSQDDRQLITGSADGAAALWDVQLPSP